MSKKNNTREFFSDLKAAPNLRSETVVVPEWDGREIFLHEPTLGATQKTRKDIIDEDGEINEEMSGYWMLSLCMVEADGSLVFENAEECKAALEDQSVAATTRLITAAGKLVNPDAVGAVKNLKETPAGSSSTD